MARNRLSRSRRNKRYSEIDFRLPEALLRLDWSPDQIVDDRLHFYWANGRQNKRVAQRKNE